MNNSRKLFSLKEALFAISEFRTPEPPPCNQGQNHCKRWLSIHPSYKLPQMQELISLRSIKRLLPAQNKNGILKCPEMFNKVYSGLWLNSGCKKNQRHRSSIFLAAELGRTKSFSLSRRVFLTKWRVHTTDTFCPSIQ